MCVSVCASVLCLLPCDYAIKMCSPNRIKNKLSLCVFDREILPEKQIMQTDYAKSRQCGVSIRIMGQVSVRKINISCLIYYIFILP